MNNKIVSILASILLICTLFFLIIIISARSYLNYDNVYNTIEKIYHKDSTYDDNYFSNFILNRSTYKEELAPYLDSSKIEEEYLSYVSKYILYINGIPKYFEPDSTNLSNIIKEGIINYQKDTGTQISSDEITNIINSTIKNAQAVGNQNDDFKKIIELIYSNNVISIILAITVISLILIIIFNREFKYIIKNISIILLSLGILLILFRLFIPLFIINSDKYLSGLINGIGTYILVFGSIILIIGIISFIISKKTVTN